MKNASILLWVDCSAGAAVGIATLLMHPWLVDFYGFSKEFILVIGGANVLYGCFSFTLAVQKKRATLQFGILVAANVLWACLCLVFAATHWDTASAFGIAHLILECLFVGGLGVFEWLYRNQLRLNTS